MPERDDRGAEPEADALGARREVRRHQQRVAEQLAAPDAEVMLRHPEHLQAGLVAELRQLAHLGNQVAVVARLAGIMDVVEVAESHGS